VALAVATAVTTPVARAYDFATTHAGLTERSVLASSLHRVLVRRLSRPLGLFEPITLRLGDLPAEKGKPLGARLDSLDPSAGYRPAPDGVSSALSWVVAGSVLAGTPAERAQNLFYDPSRGSGLSQAGGAGSIGYGLRLLVDEGGGGTRAFATGTSFNMTGRPSTEWLVAPENDVGLVAFHEGLEAAVAGDDPATRSNALVRALMALGGTLAVLQEAGDPAHVRNDFRGAYLGGGGASPFDRGSAFERFVSETYGRMGVPKAGTAVSRPTVMAFITAGDAQGLADRTQRRFFSDGTLPEDAIVDRDTSTADVMKDARLTVPYGLPRVPRLELSVLGKRRYAYAPAEAGAASNARRRRLFAYERVPGRVRFLLDEGVYADSARALLPEIGAYGAGLIDHLFRVELRISTENGLATVAVTGARGKTHDGQLRLFAEDTAGHRRVLGSADASSDSLSAAIPAGTRRVAAVLRGQDDAGELVAVAEAPVR
jgi:hypothetical protein